MNKCIISFILLTLLGSVAHASESVATLRGSTDLDKQSKPPGFSKVLNTDVKRKTRSPVEEARCRERFTLHFFRSYSLWPSWKE